MAISFYSTRPLYTIIMVQDCFPTDKKTIYVELLVHNFLQPDALPVSKHWKATGAYLTMKLN